jgi:hypothetical protein
MEFFSPDEKILIMVMLADHGNPAPQTMSI